MELEGLQFTVIVVLKSIELMYIFTFAPAPLGNLNGCFRLPFEIGMSA